MNQKQYKVKVILYLFVICLLVGIINSNDSSSTPIVSFFSDQSFAHDELSSSSSLNRSSNILEMIQQVNASLLRIYIKKIQEFGPHPTGSKACEEVGKYLYDTLRSFQVPVSYHPWKYKLHSGNNIVASLPGKQSDDIVVVSAHYDSVSISPGANDDGSGVAVVLTVAKIMSQYNFNCTIRFVLFSGEEQGLLGSHEYVQNASRHGENIVGDLNLDGVGYTLTVDDGNKIKHHANNQSTWMVDICKTIASEYNDQIGLEVIGFPHVSFSDHESFVQYNYDASYLWEYAITPYYHTSEDTLEHMNITYLAKICKLTVGTLASMAELHPRLSDDDLRISIKGRASAYPCQFYVRIENTKSISDTANVTINIALKNLWTGKYVVMMIHTDTITCNWTLMKEIETVWEFKISGRQYSNQFIFLKVIVKGIKDDLTLYTSQQRIGIIVDNWIFLFPFE